MKFLQDLGSMNKIKFKNIKFYAYHGVSIEEKKLGQKFEIDIDIKFRYSSDTSSDNISNTINYVGIYEIAKREMYRKKYDLIETLALNIVNKVLKLDLVQEVVVRVRKPNIPLKAYVDSIEVEMKRVKSD